MIFVDTSFLYPLFSANDPDHARVAEVLASYRGRATRDLFVMSNHVVAETMTLIRMTPPRSHAAAVRAAESLYAETLGRVHWASVEEERAAFAYFKRHRDKEYSFVDCLSFVLMEGLGIHEALAVDSDFTHRFTALPGPFRRSTR